MEQADRERLYAEVEPVYLSYARWILSRWNVPRYQWEDLLQEARVGTWQATQTYNPSKGPVRWWFRLKVKSTLRDALQDVKYRAAISGDGVGDEVADRMVGVLDCGLSALLAEEFLCRVLERSRIKEKYWPALRAIVTEGLRRDEAAALAGTTAAYMYQLMFRVRTVTRLLLRESSTAPPLSRSPKPAIVMSPPQQSMPTGENEVRAVSRRGRRVVITR